MDCIKNKKAAEESNMIIFIILALIVAGLVIWFSYGFFGTGTRLIDGNDPSVDIALQSCKVEIARSASALCSSPKTIKIRGGGEMIINCVFLNNSVRSGELNQVIATLPEGSRDCTNNFFVEQCKLIEDSGVSKSDLEKIIVNGVRCKVSSPEGDGERDEIRGTPIELDDNQIRLKMGSDFTTTSATYYKSEKGTYDIIISEGKLNVAYVPNEGTPKEYICNLEETIGSCISRIGG
jgi:hypothetical protein